MKIFCASLLLLLLGIGCADHPITTGAPAYWEAAHVERVAPRTEEEKVASERFYPAPAMYKPERNYPRDESEPPKETPRYSEERF